MPGQKQAEIFLVTLREMLDEERQRRMAGLSIEHLTQAERFTKANAPERGQHRIAPEPAPRGNGPWQGATTGFRARRRFSLARLSFPFANL
ncbi:MAG: hypothetical protein JJT95_05560 [Pararhodobacter sp.]|nr:hypothetical protein [Pararhodobacter sp.]